MSVIDKKFVRGLNSLEKIFNNIRDGKNTAVFGMSKFEKPFITHGFENFVLYVAADFVEAQEMLANLNSYGNSFVYLPPREEVLFNKKITGIAFNAERSMALAKMISGSGGVVTTLEALLQKYPNRLSFGKNILSFKKNGSADIIELAKSLVKIGYRYDEDLTLQGTFTRRGDILDVFCAGAENPVRFEFFGDLIEDLRIVDRETKKSLGKIEEVTVIPVRTLFDEDFSAQHLIDTIKAGRSGQKLSPDAAARLNTICGEVFDEIASGVLDNAWVVPFVKHSTLADYLPCGSVVIWDEPKLLNDRKTLITTEHLSRVSYLLEKGEILPAHSGQLLDGGLLPLTFEKAGQIFYQNIAATNDLFRPEDIVNLKSSPVINYRFDIKLLAQDVKSWVKNEFKTVIFAGECDSCERVRKELASFGQSVPTDGNGVYSVNSAVITQGEIKHGFVNHTDKLVFVGQEDIFNKVKPKAKLRKTAATVFTAPEVGDYVVHDLHGIGLCEGIVTLNGSFGVKDFILVKYRDSDKLYVPVESANLLARYSGSEHKPKLSRLGGNEFEKVKARVKKNIKEMAIDLAGLYASRQNSRGFVYRGDSYLEQQFCEAFPYQETADQLKCIEDVFKDMETDKIMDRLICGDVGYGKTEVALRAAFKVILSGKQVAFLSPTTILSEQHFRTVIKRFADFGIKTGCLNRFRTKKEQSAIIEGLKDGSVNFVCGTHRLLSKDVKFENLGLLILDEEQRFGVEAKETIKTLKKNVDVLTLSATPIPRTLHMALTGMRDISVILTPPKARLPVQTSVLEGNENLIRDIILRETGRGGQVFLVYNRVETIDLFAAKLQKLVPSARFTVAHGQMDEHILEDNIYNFSQGLSDVLVSSSIIENGIDIPNANTLIVYDADCFGLSQLYQLRGRVGRSDRPAYAYFMYRENKVLSEIAYKRLSSILEYTELGSGFKIAVRDLELRGAGDVLGREQHGHMEKIGYDMYCKLLAESINEIKGNYSAVARKVSLDIALDASAANYINDDEARMSFYQRLSSVSVISDVDELRNEITDIFGAPPKETLNLLEVAAFKISAQNAGLSEVVIKPKTAYICFENADMLKQPKVFNALDKFKSAAQLDISKKLQITFNWGIQTVEQMFDKVKDFVAFILDK